MDYGSMGHDHGSVTHDPFVISMYSPVKYISLNFIYLLMYIEIRDPTSSSVEMHSVQVKS